MQPVCAALNLIQIKYPFRIILVGIKSLEKRPGPCRVGHFFSKIVNYFWKLTIPTSSQDFFRVFYAHIIQRWEEFLFGLNLELHRFDAFLRLEATVQLYIEVAGKILGWSFIFGVRSVENCYKKGTLKNLTTPNAQKSHSQGPIQSLVLLKMNEKYLFQNSVSRTTAS